MQPPSYGSLTSTDENHPSTHPSGTSKPLTSILRTNSLVCPEEQEQGPERKPAVRRQSSNVEFRLPEYEDRQLRHSYHHQSSYDNSHSSLGPRERTQSMIELVEEERRHTLPRRLTIQEKEDLFKDRPDLKNSPIYSRSLEAYLYRQSQNQLQEKKQRIIYVTVLLSLVVMVYIFASILFRTSKERPEYRFALIDEIIHTLSK